MRLALLIVLNLAFVCTAFSDHEVPKRDFSGLYAGVILGPQFGNSSFTTGSLGYNADNDTWTFDQTGLNAGAGFGYGIHLNSFVFGPEIELGYLSARGAGAQPSSPGLDTIGRSKNDVYAAFRGRVGYDLGRYLVFATGGAILSNHTSEIVDSCNIAPCGGTKVSASKTDTVWGYTVGGGVEHLFSCGWSVKLEYLYFNLGSQSLSGTTNLGTAYDWTSKSSGNIIRGGVNYYF